jgi:hypothetical protein
VLRVTLLFLVLAGSAASAAQSAPADEWRPLYRSLKVPRLQQGAVCPVSSVAKDVDFHRFGIADGYGPGPAYPVGIHAGRLPVAWRTGAFSGAWGGQKVLWWVHPSYRGPVLIRGRQLDGPYRVRFDRGTLPPVELRIGRGVSDGVSDPGRGRPSYTRVRAPGCYGYQIDGTSFSRVIVFEAVSSS